MRSFRCNWATVEKAELPWQCHRQQFNIIHTILSVKDSRYDYSEQVDRMRGGSIYVAERTCFLPELVLFGTLSIYLVLKACGFSSS